MFISENKFNLMDVALLEAHVFLKILSNKRKISQFNNSHNNTFLEICLRASCGSDLISMSLCFSVLFIFFIYPYRFTKN